MADGDEQFRIGVEHGLNDEPCYRWQDRRHQECYDAGYVCGQTQRVMLRRRQTIGSDDLGWADFCRRMKQRGWDRSR